MSITAEGGDAPFSNVGYTPHDENGAVIVNATGNNKVFIRAKSSVPNTLLRIDLIDSLNYATTQPSITKVIGEEYEVREYNFSNQYIDAGFGGSACEEGTGPCPVDGTIIQTMLIYPNPADGGFNGTIDIDYISFGKPLGEDVAADAYSDEFDDGDISKFGMTDGVVVAENEGVLTMTGNGTSGEFASISYLPHDPETGEDLVLDITSNNKVYLKAKSTTPLSLRMDVEDAAGFASTEPSTVRAVTEEYQILEFDYTGTYMDGGYGGTECEEGTGPCPVDGSMVGQFIFYLDPGVGMFDGELTIEWLSTLLPLEEDTVDLGPLGVDVYMDEFLTNDLTFVSDNDGLAVSAVDDIVTITGDGSQGQFAPIGFMMNDGTDSIIVNASNNANKVFIRMKSSLDTTTMRVDLVDNLNFHTTLAGLEQDLSSEFAVYEYDYSGKYSDGGFGGTACENGTGPCTVDPERIQAMQFYIDPGQGGFAGSVDIDWISFGEPIISNVVDTEVVSQAKVYPNPAQNEINLLLDARVAGKMTATFFDVAGRMVATQQLGKVAVGENSRTISLNQVNEGMYFLRVTIDNKDAFFQKIFVK